MRWLQKNQGHLLVVERARNDNNAKRMRLPPKTVVFTYLVMTWGFVWLLSVLLYSIRAALARRHDSETHEHFNLRQSSPLLKELKRPKTGKCFFHPQEQPQFGYLAGDCVTKQACPFRETLAEARDACLLSTKCVGVTFVPWEDRYELRESDKVTETYDGQMSFLKRCDFGVPKATRTLNARENDEVEFGGGLGKDGQIADTDDDDYVDNDSEDEDGDDTGDDSDERGSDNMTPQVDEKTLQIHSPGYI